MQDTTKANEKIDALLSETGSLKSVIEQLAAEKQALDQTMMELLRANISLKAGASILEKRLSIAMQEAAKKPHKLIEESPKDDETKPAKFKRPYMKKSKISAS